MAKYDNDPQGRAAQDMAEYLYNNDIDIVFTEGHICIKTAVYCNDADRLQAMKKMNRCCQALEINYIGIERQLAEWGQAYYCIDIPRADTIDIQRFIRLIMAEYVVNITDKLEARTREILINIQDPEEEYEY